MNRPDARRVRCYLVSWYGQAMIVQARHNEYHNVARVFASSSLVANIKGHLDGVKGSKCTVYVRSGWYPAPTSAARAAWCAIASQLPQG